MSPVISVQAGSQVSGKIAKLYADFNSIVREGQVLASIDQKPYQAKVSQARAALKSAQANLAKARNILAQRTLELHRMTDLRSQQFVAQSDLDLARTNYHDAVAQVDLSLAQVDQAKATLSSAELDLGYTTIYSPVNGTVVSRNAEEGQTVVASFQTPTLFVIAQDLVEAIGGVVGVLFGILAARLLTHLIGWPTIISSQAVAVAFLFSLAVGIFFGLYPANKASRMNPIEALHWE